MQVQCLNRKFKKKFHAYQQLTVKNVINLEINERILLRSAQWKQQYKNVRLLLFHPE